MVLAAWKGRTYGNVNARLSLSVGWANVKQLDVTVMGTHTPGATAGLTSSARWPKLAAILRQPTLLDKPAVAPGARRARESKRGRS